VSARLRSALSAVLVSLSCLLVPFGAPTAWAAYGPADTDRYVATMAPPADGQDVRGAVADMVGDGVLREVDSVRRGAMGPYVQDAAHPFTRAEAFRAGWAAANRAVHEAVLRTLRDDRGREGPVTVGLAPVTARIKTGLARDHVPGAHRIPVRHTEVAVLPAADVHRFRKGYRLLDAAALWLPFAAVAFAVAGITSAACRRRAVTATGLGTALGGALLVVAVAIGRHLTLTGRRTGPHRPAAAAVYDALTAPLRTASWLLVVLGLTVSLASWLTGRYGHLVRRRRAPAPGQPSARAPRL
jgi:hypothetical protein